MLVIPVICYRLEHGLLKVLVTSPEGEGANYGNPLSRAECRRIGLAWIGGRSASRICDQKMGFELRLGAAQGR